MFDLEIAYQALTSHDTRFDGVFLSAVTSTGIYCSVPSVRLRRHS